jgi:hypothetical protein
MEHIHNYALVDGIVACEKCGEVAGKCPPHHYILNVDSLGICKYCGSKKKSIAYQTAMKKPNTPQVQTLSEKAEKKTKKKGRKGK